MKVTHRTLTDPAKFRVNTWLTDGVVPRLRWYRRKDSVSAQHRVGDAQIAHGPWALDDITAQWLDDRRSEFATAAHDARTTARANGQPMQGRPRKTNAGITWADAWAHLRPSFAVGVEGARKRSDKTLAAVDRDVRLYFTQDGAPGFELWRMPIAKTSTLDIAEVITRMHGVRDPDDADVWLYPPRPSEERRAVFVMKSTATRAHALLPPGNRVGPGLVIDGLAQVRLAVNAHRNAKYPACTNIVELRDLLKRLDELPDHGWQVKAAVKLQAWTGHRSRTVTNAPWAHFHGLDGKGQARWTTPRSMMKVKDRIDDDHHIVLPPVLVEWLKALPSYADRNKPGALLFPSVKLDAETGITDIDDVLRLNLGMAGKHVPHGWRSSIETLARGVMTTGKQPVRRFDQTWIDAVTDHVPQGVQARYTRAQQVEGGAQVTAWWVEHLGGYQVAKRKR